MYEGRQDEVVWIDDRWYQVLQFGHELLYQDLELLFLDKTQCLYSPELVTSDTGHGLTNISIIVTMISTFNSFTISKKHAV